MQGRTRPVPLFRWSNNAAKDLLTEQMRGLAGEWTIPRRVEALYLKQITAERRAEKTDARLSSRSFGAKTDGRVSCLWKQVRSPLKSEISNFKFRGRVSYFWKQVRRDNHLGDCELMIIVAAVITKTLQVKVKPQ